MTSTSASDQQPPSIATDPATGGVRVLGTWTLANIDLLSTLIARTSRTSTTQTLDGSGITRLDSAGVLMLARYAEKLGLQLDDVSVRTEQRDLVHLVECATQPQTLPKRDLGFVAMLERVGFAVQDNWNEILALIGFFGLTLVTAGKVLMNPARLRLTSTIYHMEQVGLNAVPLVALLSFLVGAVIAFLGATVLQDFGASVFVVELVTYSFLREFGVLLTAILLAGRTASAFTAQIGAMQSNEEIDAMRAIGLDPIEVLVLPRVLALVIMLPLLTFLAMIAGQLGGLLVGATSLGIPPDMYMTRVSEIITLTPFLVGMSKAPIFAVVIALIGCLEGMQVEGTAQSVGERTTSSVVQSIALVIVIDAIAALYFMHMDW